MRQTGLVAFGLITTLAGSAAVIPGPVVALDGGPDAPAETYAIQSVPLAATPPRDSFSQPGGEPPPSGSGGLHRVPDPPRPSPGPAHPPRRDNRDHGRSGDWYHPNPTWPRSQWGWSSPWYGPYYPYYPYPYYPYPDYPYPSPYSSPWPPTWVPGHWEWNGWQWVWQPGYWRYN
jgi:hypothetical protein